MRDEVRRLTLAEMGKREFDIVSRGVCYRYTVAGAGLVFTFDRLRWKWDELHCELTVTSSMAGTQTVNGDVISQASFNVSSDRARAERATRVSREAMLSDLPVSRLVEEACQQVLNAERSAVGVVNLHDVPDSEAAALFTCDGITIDMPQISMFYGLPGSGKSLQAARMALRMAREGYRVGYVDFEWAPGPHKKRARLLEGPEFPPIAYIRLERPLVQEIDGLRRTAINDGWDYAFIDSVSFGVSGPPESAEVASGFLQACRQLRIGQTLVAHQTKAEGGDKYPFGSIMWYAGARDIYHFRRSNSEQATDVLVSAVTHRKSNAGALKPTIAIEYAFTPDRITVQLVNPAGLEDIASELSIRQRLRHALRAGPQTIDDLADQFEVKPNSIVQALTRDEASGKKGKARQFVRLPDSKVALFAERIS